MKRTVVSCRSAMTRASSVSQILNLIMTLLVSKEFEAIIIHAGEYIFMCRSYDNLYIWTSCRFLWQA